MVDISGLFKRPTFLLKLLEMLLSAIGTALVSGNVTVAWDLNHVAVIYVTLIGYMMVGIIVILGYLLDTPLHKLLLMLINTSGCVMFVTAGSLMCHFYGETFQGGGAAPRLLAAGILAISNSGVYAADAFFTFKEVEL